jgi:F-box-like
MELPNEILCVIFDYFGPQERALLRTVCTKWAALMPQRWAIVRIGQQTPSNGPVDHIRALKLYPSLYYVKVDHFNLSIFPNLEELEIILDIEGPIAHMEICLRALFATYRAIIGQVKKLTLNFLPETPLPFFAPFGWPTYTKISVRRALVVTIGFMDQCLSCGRVKAIIDEILANYSIDLTIHNTCCTEYLKGRPNVTLVGNGSYKLTNDELEQLNRMWDVPF